jgi:hypothetical protein
MAADQAARQDTVSGDTDSKVSQRWQDVLFDAPRDQGILDLQVGDRVRGGRWIS